MLQLVDRVGVISMQALPPVVVRASKWGVAHFSRQLFPELFQYLSFSPSPLCPSLSCPLPYPYTPLSLSLNYI